MMSASGSVRENCQSERCDSKNTSNPVCNKNEAVSQKKSRKQWTVQDSPRGLLRRMRSQLAEDGCPESQLVLAKSLLALEDQESHQRAVFWLTQSSLQGNLEATELLDNCLKNNIGICEYNYKEVRDCLAMDIQEKLARTAAQTLFNDLCDGNDFITSLKLARHIQELSTLDKNTCLNSSSCSDRKFCDDPQNLEKRFGGERFTRDHLVSSASLYAQGFLPPVQYFLNHFHKPCQSYILDIIQWPCGFVCKYYEEIIIFLGRKLVKYFSCILNLISPLAGLLLLLICLGICANLSDAVTVNVFPGFIWLVSMLCMVVSTAAIVVNTSRLQVFQLWSLILSHYCHELNTGCAEMQFMKHCWKPYMGMFCGLFFFLWCVPYLDKGYLIFPLPVFTVFTLITVLSLSNKVRQCCMLLLYLLAVVPSAHKVIQQIIHLTPFTMHIFIEDIHFDVGGIMQLHIGIGPLFHMLWCIALATVVVCDGYRAALAHLVNSCWCHLAVMAFQDVTTPGNLFWSAILWSAFALVPLASSLVGIALPSTLAAGSCFIAGLEVTSCIAVFLFLAVVLCIVNWLWSDFTIFLKLLFIIPSLVYLFHPLIHKWSGPLIPSDLEWDAFKNVCLPSKETVAVAMRGCLPLLGTVVKWQGRISGVSIASVRNWPREIISLFPHYWENSLRCQFGHALPLCQRSNGSEININRCQLLRSVLGSNYCSLDNWDEYTFDVTISMSSSFWKFDRDSPQVTLSADNNFRKFLFDVSEGDEVELIGTLVDKLGTLQPRLKLSSIACIKCHLNLTAVVPFNYNKPGIRNSLFSIANFFLGPTLTV